MDNINIINNFFDNVYLVNLEKSKDRLNNITKILNNENIKFERFNAVYGKELSDEYIKTITTNFCYNFCPKSVIGCALSHILIWKDILKKNYKNSLILEDDIYFDENYKNNLKKSLNELPHDWDIVYLGCGGLCNKDNKNNLSEFISKIIFQKINNRIIYNNYIFIPEYPTGTFSYGISNNGCRKLLNIIKKIEKHIDSQMSSNNYTLNVYAVNPKCIYPNTNESIISNNSNVLLNNMLNKIEDNNRIKYSWYFNLVIYEYKGIQFNLWSIIFLIFGFLSYYKRYILYLVILLFIIELIYYNINNLYNLFYFIFGFIFGILSYYSIKNIKFTEHLIIHIVGSIIGIILIFNGLKYNLLGYTIPGVLWFATNMTFLLYSEKVFDKFLGNKKSLLFPILFMAIPALIMGLIVIYNTYKHNNQIIRLIILIVIIVDIIHLFQFNKKLGFIIIILLFIIIYIIRFFNKKHYDDLTPLLEPNYYCLEKSDIIFIIPKYKNIPLTKYPQFIKKIKKYAIDNNKELAMHGVTHYPEGFFQIAEFGYPLTYEYIKEGIDIFENAFGYKPKKFKAPCYNLHPHNEKILKSFNIEIVNVETLLLNKLYHNDNDKILSFFNIINLYF